MSAYEAIWGPYNWNCFPLAPPGCKVVIYESPNTQELWGSCGTDAWYLGPLVDHYRCNHYFVPKTRAYQISGSAELFPQHCQVLFLTTKDHLQELTNEMVSTLGAMTPVIQRHLLNLVQKKLSDEGICPGGPTFLMSPCHAWILPEGNEQQVPQAVAPMQDQQRVVTSGEQRVGPTHEIILIKDLRRMSEAPPIMNVPNPTTKRVLKLTKRVHRWLTWNNIPRTVPPITRVPPWRPAPTTTEATPVRQSPWLGKTAQCIQNARLPKPIPQVQFVLIAGRLRNHSLISQEAINFLTNEVWNNLPPIYTPENLQPKENVMDANLEQLAMPMIHPTTGEMITSYKILMHNPATIEI
jgi:hypothetical protein